MIKSNSLVIVLLLALPPPLIMEGTYDMVHSVCFEKDDVPVDVDALFNDNCLDVDGNIYKLDSELYSCCDCFRYTCEEIETWGKQMKIGWVRSVSDQCCQNCNGTVYLPNTIISTTNLEDDCLTIKTEVCRVRPGLKIAHIEQEFTYRNCCNDNEKTLQYLGAKVPDPSTCSIRTCEYDPAWPHSVWITKKEKGLEGCDCCLLPNGTLVDDGATWLDTSVKPPLWKECCRGQIVIVPSLDLVEPIVCYGIFITGGLTGTEVYIPEGCPLEINHCLLSDEPENVFHTQDGFWMCGGDVQPNSCSTYNVASGQWDYMTHAWKYPPRAHHVSWSFSGVVIMDSPEEELLLMGGEDFKPNGPGSSSLSTNFPSGTKDFILKNMTVDSCSIQFEELVIITGGRIYPDSDGRQADIYNVDGFYGSLPLLNYARYGHACGSYIQDGNEMLIVVGGRNAVDSVEIYDLSTKPKNWTLTTYFPEKAAGYRGVTLNNTFFVTGGILIWSWDPVQKEWTVVSQMCAEHVNHGASVVPVTEELLDHCQRICYDKE